MRVMILIKSTAASEAGQLPDTTLLESMGRFNDALVGAGVLLAGEGLTPTARGKRVRFSGAQRSVVDGPFTDADVPVAGFWLWQVTSIEEAVEWVKRCPNPTGAQSEVEIRPVYEPDDFGTVLAPEMRGAPRP